MVSGYFIYLGNSANSHRLSENCNILQAEVFAITKEVEMLTEHYSSSRLLQENPFKAMLAFRAL